MRATRGHPGTRHFDRARRDKGRENRNHSSRRWTVPVYDWPGNIRELQNVIERAVILCASDTFAVEERWLKREVPPRSGPAMPLVAARAAHERALIEAALAACRGRVSGPAGAAAKLGLPRQTLASKIKALGIPLQRFKTRPAD